MKNLTIYAIALILSFKSFGQCKGLYQKRVAKDTSLVLKCDMVLMSFDSYYDYYFYKYQYNSLGDSIKFINKEIHVLRKKYKKYLDVNKELLNESEKEINKLAHNSELLRKELVKKDGNLKTALYENRRIKKQRNRAYLVILFTGLFGSLFVF